MHKRRLLKLADLLDANANNKTGAKFDMMDWGTISDPKKPLSCGTSVCAFGLAALSGAFKRAGLGYKIQDCGSIWFTWKGKNMYAVAAAERLFDIDSDQVGALFLHASPHEHGARAERAMAKQIRKLVATGQL